MNARQFFELVSQMRAAQRNYFAQRKCGDPIATKQALQYSLDLERQVDAEISRVNAIIAKQASTNQ